jgi:Rieske 2Fe-2S family protein
VPVSRLIYDLDGGLSAPNTDDLDDFSHEDFGLASVRLATWQGFVFVSLDPAAEPLETWLGDLVPHLSRFDLGGLRVAHTERYEVEANWKFIAENYSECYHCPGIHPQLNKLTPYDLGGDFAPEGPWQGGWMELVEDAQTMALDGGHRAGRPAMPSPRSTSTHLLLPVWPSTFLSIHRTTCSASPGAGRAGHTRSCEGCSAGDIAAPSFDPSVRSPSGPDQSRDWHVCGSGSAAPGRAAGPPAAIPTRGRASMRRPDGVDRYAGRHGSVRPSVAYDIPPQGRRPNPATCRPSSHRAPRRGPGG